LPGNEAGKHRWRKGVDLENTYSAAFGWPLSDEFGKLEPNLIGRALTDVRWIEVILQKFTNG
jgi:hypothetical protein